MENEANVRYALDKYGHCLSLAEQRPKLGGDGLIGEIDDGTSMRKLLNDAEAKLVQRFDPSSEMDCIGFFISKFHKFNSIEIKDNC